MGLFIVSYVFNVSRVYVYIVEGPIPHWKRVHYKLSLCKDINANEFGFLVMSVFIIRYCNPLNNFSECIKEFFHYWLVCVHSLA